MFSPASSVSLFMTAPRSECTSRIPQRCLAPDVQGTQPLRPFNTMNTSVLQPFIARPDRSTRPSRSARYWLAAADLEQLLACRFPEGALVGSTSSMATVSSADVGGTHPPRHRAAATELGFDGATFLGRRSGQALERVSCVAICDMGA
jgi:hypothetical protein